MRDVVAFDGASSDSETRAFKGSHPNLSELHKMRSATLPNSGFRTGTRIDARLSSVLFHSFWWIL